MSISSLSNLFQAQRTEEVAGTQRTRQGREAGDQRIPSSSHKTDSVTISAEAYRMAEAMRENNARQSHEQKGDQSSANSELPGETASSNAESTGKTGASVTENGVLEGATARTVPVDILARSAQHLAEIQEKGTKVLFEFGDGGAISIKPGLLREDYLRARATLREWEIHEPGLWS